MQHTTFVTSILSSRHYRDNTVFEDNLGVLELANVPKMRPRTKEIGNKYHHFCDKVWDKTISILAVATANQVADYLTKPLPRDSFQKHCNVLQKWWHTVFKASSRMRECENMGFNLIAFMNHTWTNYCFTDQGTDFGCPNKIQYRYSWPDDKNLVYLLIIGKDRIWWSTHPTDKDTILTYCF